MFNQSAPAALPDDPYADPRRHSIVEAAHALLEEGGQEALTIRAVLGRTGLARRAFYERFAGKDDLVLAVFEERLHAAAATFTRQIVQLASPMDRLKLIVTSLILGHHANDGGRNRPEGGFDRLGVALTREHLRLADSCPAELQKALQPLLSLIADLLSDGIKAGQVRDVPPQRLATLIYNLVSTTLHREYLAPGGSYTDAARRIELANDIWDFCRRAIARAEGD
jgi:AcrR family transcriptional regulator